jgi:Ca2+:H+ antiporter
MIGLCFFFGGINRYEQYFNMSVAQATSMMLLLAVVSLVVPTASRLMVSHVTNHDVVIQSRGTSVVILVSYSLYLFFQLHTHRAVYEAPSTKTKARPVMDRLKSSTVVPARFRSKAVVTAPQSHSADEEDEDELEEPQLSVWVAWLTLIISTALVALNAEYATGSVQTMVQEAGISQTFVGFVIFPLLNNDPRAIYIATKDKMDLCIGLTLDKCLQTSLLVIPVLIIVGWGMHNENFSLDFEGFPVAVTFASIIVVAYAIQQGKSHWLMGALLVKIYVIVALATYFIH